MFGDVGQARTKAWMCGTADCCNPKPHLRKTETDVSGSFSSQSNCNYCLFALNNVTNSFINNAVNAPITKIKIN